MKYESNICRDLIHISKQRESPFFDRACSELEGSLKEFSHSTDLLVGLVDSLDLYCETVSIESALVNLLPSLLQATNSKFGFLAEVCYTQLDRPYLLTHAVVDIYKTDYTIFDILSNLQFHNLDTLNGSVMTSQAPVLSNDPENDSRSSGVPFGHGKIENYLGLPFLVDGKLVGVAALANRPGGYQPTDIDALKPLCQIIGFLISDWRASN